MADPVETFADLVFPLQGVDRVQEYEQQRQGTTVQGINVRAYEMLTQRARGGSRAGLSKYIPATVNGPNKIQHLNMIVDPTEAAMLGYYSDESPDAVLDPSTADGQPRDRNPGRYIRNGGSGRQPVRKVKLAKRALTITANNQYKQQGDTYVFTGKEFTSSGLDVLDSIDTVTLTSPGAAASATAAGSPYPIVASKPVIGFVPTDDPPGKHGPAGLNLKYNMSFVNGLFYVVPAGPLAWSLVSYSAVWSVGPWNLAAAASAPAGENPHPGVFNQFYQYAASNLGLDGLGNLNSWTVTARFWSYIVNFFNVNFSSVGTVSQTFSGPTGSAGFQGTPQLGNSFTKVGTLRLSGTFPNGNGNWMYDCGTVTWTLTWAYL